MFRTKKGTVTEINFGFSNKIPQSSNFVHPFCVECKGELKINLVFSFTKEKHLGKKLKN